jgi:hypothetical protein
VAFVPRFELLDGRRVIQMPWLDPLNQDELAFGG